MATDRFYAEAITQVGDVHMTKKQLLLLQDEEFMFDPYLVRSLEAIPENARSQQGERSRITFVDGGYRLLHTDFDSLVSQIAEVSRGE